MKLREFFDNNKNVAIAFSGGVDSAYLLYEAAHSSAVICAYYVKSDFQPEFELNDAKRIAGELNVTLKIINVDVLSSSEIASNPDNRCYYCKKKIFSTIMKEAAASGFNVIADGTNASDKITDRPGMKALAELSVRSPLRECGLTKDDIRRLSKEAGLFTWDKPAYACLATRITSGELITREKLRRTEISEAYLATLGFSNFRIRSFGDNAKIQISDNQLLKLISTKNQINLELKKYYSSVLLDLEERI